MAERVNPPGSSEYLFRIYGVDFNKHANWHMDLLSLYRRGSGDALYWLQKELIAVLKYAPDKEARGAWG